MRESVLTSGRKLRTHRVPRVRGPSLPDAPSWHRRASREGSPVALVRRAARRHLADLFFRLHTKSAEVSVSRDTLEFRSAHLPFLMHFNGYGDLQVGIEPERSSSTDWAGCRIRGRVRSSSRGRSPARSRAGRAWGNRRSRVRPSESSASGTVELHDANVGADVLVQTARGVSETRDVAVLQTTRSPCSGLSSVPSPRGCNVRSPGSPRRRAASRRPADRETSAPAAHRGRAQVGRPLRNVSRN